MPDAPLSQEAQMLTSHEFIMLSFGTTEDGAMVDVETDSLENAVTCERLLAAGLLRRGPNIEYIQTYFTTETGLAAMGRIVN